MSRGEWLSIVGIALIQVYVRFATGMWLLPLLEFLRG